MGKRIIFQAGFHKTGNKSIQELFRENEDALRPYADLFFKWNINDLNAAAHAFGTLPTPYRRNQLRRSIRAACGRFSKIENATICVFAEDLCGPMPGLNSVPDYGQAPIIAKDLVRVTKQELGEKTEVSFLYTTRDPEQWMDSLYRHHILDGPMALDYHEFVEEYPKASAQQEVIKGIKRKSDADRVFVQTLEDAKAKRLGLGQTLLDIVGVPKDVSQNFKPVGQIHQGIGASMARRFLLLNREYRDLQKLKEIKNDILLGKRD